MIEPSPAAELVMAFANTIDLEEGTDALATATSTASWLRANNLGSGAHAELLELRAAVRAALAGADSDYTLPVLVSTSGQPLRPAPDTDQAIAHLAIAWAQVALTGEAERLKRCADDTCGWVFWDVSRNHSRRWCTMKVCGNRAKARRYLSRQRREPRDTPDEPPAARRGSPS